MCPSADVSEGDVPGEGGLVDLSVVLVGGEVEGEDGSAVDENGGGDVDDDVDDDAVACR